MYRILIINILLFLLLLPVSSRSSNEIPSNIKDTITLGLWGGVPYDSGPKQVVQQFNEEFSEQGIQVRYHRYVNNKQGNLKLDVTIMGGTDIDLFFSYTYKEYARRSGKMALELDTYLEDDKFNVEYNLGSDADKKSQVNGRYFGLATKRYNNGFLVNKDMFDRAEIPIPTSWTWEEFIDIAGKLSYGSGKDRVYGSYLNTLNLQNSPLEILDSELGADHLYSDNGNRVDLSNPRYKTVLKQVLSMMESRIMPSQRDVLNHKISGTTLFLNQKVAILMGTWIIRDIKKLDEYPHDFVTAYVPFPCNNTDGNYYMAGGPGDMLQINKSSRYPKEAWTFIKWYLTKGILNMAPYGRMPLNNKTDTKILAENLLSGFEEYFDVDSIINGYIKPSENYSVPVLSSPIVVNILKEELENIYYGVKTVDKALEDAERRANITLNKLK